MQALNKLQTQNRLYLETTPGLRKVDGPFEPERLQHLPSIHLRAGEPGIMRVVMIEKEKNSLKYLEDRLSLLGNMPVVKKLRSVKDAKEYFEDAVESADLIFSEVELKDGFVMDVIAGLDWDIPVVYLSQTDKHREKALATNGLDYFIIPDQYKELMAAFSLYSKMNLYAGRSTAISNAYNFPGPQKERIIGKKGLESIILMIEDIAIIHTHNNLVFALTRDNLTYRIDKKLNELEAELSGSGFFRISRQCIVNIKFIKGYKTIDKIKLSLSMKDIKWKDLLIVSQDYTPGFKKWIRSC